jgi:hypothetical protein
MFEWLSSLPQWFQVIVYFTVVLLGAFIAIMIVVIGVKRGIWIKTKFGSLGIARNRNKDITIIFNECIRVITEKLEIQFNRTVRKQMYMVEEKVEELLAQLESFYIKKLKEKKVIDIMNNLSYRTYKLILFVLQHHLLKFFRLIFRENGFIKFDEKEFRNYAGRKANLLNIKSVGVLNELYFCVQDIPLEELYESCFTEAILEPLFLEVLFSARDTALESKQEMDTLDKKLVGLVERGVELFE